MMSLIAQEIEHRQGSEHTLNSLPREQGSPIGIARA